MATRGLARISCGRASPAESPALTCPPSPSSGCATASPLLAPKVILLTEEVFAPSGLRFWFLLLAGVDAVVADMLDLPFEHESFDLVIEKGTMVCNVNEFVPSCVCSSLTK